MIRGILEKKEEDYFQEVQDFFKNKLLIQDTIKVNNMYRMGQSKQRPLLVQLAEYKQKSIIFQNAKKLKGVTNENQQNYSISDHLPEEKNEIRQRGREIVFLNKVVPEAQRPEIKLKVDKVFVNNTQYKKQVLPLTAHELHIDHFKSG